MKLIIFEVYHTGGNCTAWRGLIPDTDMYMLITQDLSHHLDPELPIEFGIYKSPENPEKEDDIQLGFFELDLDNMK